eukprot:5267230-Heterocapsa_arctica.AAC.1
MEVAAEELPEGPLDVADPRSNASETPDSEKDTARRPRRLREGAQRRHHQRQRRSRLSRLCLGALGVT